MDEFDRMRYIQNDLLTLTPEEAKRILQYLTTWNNTRPEPPAGDK